MGHDVKKLIFGLFASCNSWFSSVPAPLSAGSPTKKPRIFRGDTDFLGYRFDQL